MAGDNHPLDRIAALDRIAEHVGRLQRQRSSLVVVLLDLVRQIMLADLDTEEERIIYPGLAGAVDNARALLREIPGSDG